MWQKTSITLAGLLGATAVMMGAYHAHGMENRFTANFDASEVAQRMAWCQTAYQYQLIHAVVLFGLGCWMTITTGMSGRIAAIAIIVGTTLFCGSLYGLAFTQVRGWAHVAPFGGLSLIAGWLALAISGLRYRPDLIRVDPHTPQNSRR